MQHAVEWRKELVTRNTFCERIAGCTLLSMVVLVPSVQIWVRKAGGIWKGGKNGGRHMYLSLSRDRVKQEKKGSSILENSVSNKGSLWSEYRR